MDILQLVCSIGLIGCGMYFTWVAVHSWFRGDLRFGHCVQLMALGGLSIFVGSLNFMY